MEGLLASPIGLAINVVYQLVCTRFPECVVRRAELYSDTLKALPCPLSNDTTPCRMTEVTLHSHVYHKEKTPARAEDPCPIGALSPDTPLTVEGTGGLFLSCSQLSGLCLVRWRANSAHIRQSRPDSGLGFQVKILKT